MNKCHSDIHQFIHTITNRVNFTLAGHLRASLFEYKIQRKESKGIALLNKILSKMFNSQDHVHVYLNLDNIIADRQ